MHPRNAYSSDEEYWAAMRDEFAGQALVGLLASRDEAAAMRFHPHDDAAFCYVIADAMLKARCES